MRSLSIRWLLLGVSAAVLVLPALSLVALRSYTGYLVRRTEEQLVGQAVLIGETFRAAWLRERGLAPEAEPPEESEPGAWRSSEASRYEPIALLTDGIRERSPPEPDHFPRIDDAGRGNPAFRAGRAIEPLIRRAQVHNLSAVRVLDHTGCVVATTRGDAQLCLGELPEVERALGGSYAAVLRARVSDEPPPALSSISRRGDQRVFVALPIFEGKELIGVVRLSRTAESGLEWIWKNRLPLLGGTALVITAALVLSLVSASLIARPLGRMAKAAGAVAGSGAAWPEDVVGHAPRELSVLGDALHAMTERLAERANYISTFAANVSHELKTPLTSIRGAVELLREDWQSMSAEQRERFLANIQADSERTESLARDLLQLARIENPPEPVSAPPRKLGEIARALRSRYSEHVEVTVGDPDATVAIAEGHLESAAGNLIDNALRHRTRKPVRVSLATHGERLELVVEDDGPGISPANLPRIFDRFFTTERDRGGTGLGLSIVKAIAESRGGSAECHESPGKTRFRVVL